EPTLPKEHDFESVIRFNPHLKPSETLIYIRSRTFNFNSNKIITYDYLVNKYISFKKVRQVE
ncbi:hypothetical protein TU57_20835, partial [Bacillus cereus]